MARHPDAYAILASATIPTTANIMDNRIIRNEDKKERLGKE